ncbi:MAG: beta-glucosidase [Bacteroidales bacterium]|nr:beta-glucosidase [Bacteroidales bacterium]
MAACGKTPQPEPDPDPSEPAALPRAMVVSAAVDGRTVPVSGSLGNASLSPVISLMFTRSVSVDEESLSAVHFSGGDLTASVSGSDASVLQLKPVSTLESLTKYTVSIDAGECFGVKLKEAYSFSFTTVYDGADKYPRISDDELLTLVQRQTFKYFWDYAHPVSGLARERLGSGDTVTSGGSGFGIMCLPAGVERGFVSREEAAERLRTIVAFLGTKADRFHGAFSHWLNGSTGKVIPFSANDNGGDLVETAFLIQGLLAAAGYFDRPEEADIRSGIYAIWRDVEWDWYTRGGQNVLYWHWSPSAEWAMNMPIRGWNEGLIVYVLAASSPTHPVSADVYHKGWASNGTMKPTQNGPLFFSHYSFLGLDPHGLKDKYADYWAQNVAHARYNFDYCVRNPQGHSGYGATSWGLTACDIPGGYSACAPTNDLGVVAPTAALASMPYTPEESLAALHTFYYVYGDKLWGNYGFHDSFCLDKAWFAPSYIAIDQGPIVVMIENYRTGLLWNSFMRNADVAAGLARLGFER